MYPAINIPSIQFHSTSINPHVNISTDQKNYSLSIRSSIHKILHDFCIHMSTLQKSNPSNYSSYRSPSIRLSIYLSSWQSLTHSSIHPTFRYQSLQLPLFIHPYNHLTPWISMYLCANVSTSFILLDICWYIHTCIQLSTHRLPSIHLTIQPSTQYI